MYKYLKDVPSYWHEEIKQIIDAGAMSGYGGEGEDREIRLKESAARLLAIMVRFVNELCKSDASTTADPKAIIKLIGEMLIGK